MLDETFARLVAEEVKNRVTDEQREYLRLPENWTRWQRALMVLAENLNNQLNVLTAQEKDDTERYKALGDAGLKLLAETLSEYETRRKKISRFKFHVDTRLDEITRMIALGSEAVDERLKTVDFLRKAIERHQSLLQELDMEPTSVDKALWATLDGKWEFDDITTIDY
jgi:chromosome segregation ATPase